jgi:hypothetical protein
MAGESQLARDSLREARVQSFMVRLLQAKDPELRAMAAAVFTCPGRQGAAGADAALAAGLLPQLKRLLTSPYLGMQALAADAFNCTVLSAQPVRRAAALLRQPAARALVRHLVPLLARSRSTGVRDEAAAALENVSLASAAAARRIAGCPQAVRQLAQLLSFEGSALRSVPSCSISNSTRWLGPLTAASVRSSAAHCIGAVVRRCGGGTAAAFLEAGAAAPLLRMLDADEGEEDEEEGEEEGEVEGRGLCRQRMMALQALCCLVAVGGGQARWRLVEAGAVQALQPLARHQRGAPAGDSTVQQLVGCALLQPAMFLPVAVARVFGCAPAVAAQLCAQLQQEAAAPAGPAAAEGAQRRQQPASGPAAAELAPAVRATAAAAAGARVCAVCRRPEAKLRLCSACRGVCYCSAECQRADWPRHRGECAGGGVPAARRQAVGCCRVGAGGGARRRYCRRCWCQGVRCLQAAGGQAAAVQRLQGCVLLQRGMPAC